VGWRNGCVLSAVIMALLNLPVLVFPIALRPEAIGMRPFGEGAAPEQLIVHKPAPAKKPGAFLFLTVFFFGTVSAFVSAFSQHFTTFADSLSLPVAVGARMLSACMISNTASKVVFGVMADGIGTKRAVLCFSVLLLVGVGLPLITRAPFVLYLSAVLIGLSYCLMAVGISMISFDLFGAESYAKFYPKVSPGMTVGMAAGAFLYGWIFDKSGSYMGMLSIDVVLIVVLIVLVMVAYGRRQRDRAAVT